MAKENIAHDAALVEKLRKLKSEGLIDNIKRFCDRAIENAILKLITKKK